MEMKKSRLRIAMLGFATFAFLIPTGHAQVSPSAFGPGHTLWVGVDYANFSASFPYQSGQRLQGIGVFVDYHRNTRICLEGEALFNAFGGFANSTESSYLTGPKIFFFQRNKLRPYGKFLIGVGHIHYPFDIGDANYFALVPGSGADYMLDDHWFVHVEYEYQIWHNSPGFANVPDHPLRPNGLNVGIAYRFSRW